LGAKAVDGLPHFLELLHSGNQESAYAGARALAFTSTSSPEALQDLTDALSDPKPQVRDAADHGISLLMNRGTTNLNAASVLPLLVRNLQDNDQTVRADTATTLMIYIQWQHSLGKAADYETVIPVLVKTLSDKWRYARQNAARALGEYRQKASDAAPQLEVLLSDPDEQVRSAAAIALQQIAAKQAGQ
jgi:HEAT repeat protein